MNKFHKARMLHRLNMVDPCTRDRDGKIKTANVSGSSAKSYQVILWRKNGSIQSECRLNTPVGGIPCKSNSHLCYHALSVVLQAAHEAGKQVAFCNTHEKARNLSNLGGKVIKVSVRGSDKYNYLVAS